jgi:HEAT repeat protein
MPKHVKGQPKQGRSKPNSKFSQTEANLPKTDSIDWTMKILSGPTKQRRAAMGEAAEKKDVHAVPALIAALGEDEGLDAAVALGQIEWSEKQFKSVCNYAINGDDELQNNAIYALGEYQDPKALPVLEEALNDQWLASDAAEAIGKIARKHRALVQNSDVASIMINYILDPHQGRYSIDVLVECAKALGEIRDKRAITPLKRLLNYSANISIDGDIELREETSQALRKLGVSRREVDSILKKTNPIKEYLDGSSQNAIYELLSTNRDIKRIVLENPSVLEVLPNKQAWITVNDPQLAKDLLEAALEKLGKKKSGLDKSLRSTLGVRLNQLEDAHFTYYADEILDTISHFVNNSKLKDDEKLSSLLSQIRYGNGGVQLRYVRREMADLSLGDKCGDCTAKGSVNFGNSVTWLASPAYQILKMSKGKRFIGKINFTLGTLAGQDALIIDALEFNPQAQKGKPYYEDALESLDVALSFMRNLARSENRKLFALCVSNSSGAVELLQERGRHSVTGQKMEKYIETHSAEEFAGDSVDLNLITPNEDVSRILSTVGYSGEVKLFYQMLDSSEDGYEAGVLDSKNVGSKELSDKKLPALEREVINPVQIENPDIAAAMRKRDYEQAAKLILSDPEQEGKIKEIFSLPKEWGVSPIFLSTRLEKIYSAKALDSESLGKTFVMKANRFVRL